MWICWLDVCEQSDVFCKEIALRQSKWRDGEVATNARGPGYIRRRRRPDYMYRLIGKGMSVGRKALLRRDEKYVGLLGGCV